MTTPRRQSCFARILILVALSMSTLLAGCSSGGSGSSGFDIAESMVLDRVTEDGQCEDFDGLLICPAESGPEAEATPTSTAPPTSSPTPTPTPDSVDVPTPGITATPPQPFPTETPTASPFGTDGPDATMTPTQSSTATPSPTMMPSLAVITNLVGLDDVQLCRLVEDSGSCSLLFEFSVVGFPEDAAFRVASRVAGAEAPWDIHGASSESLPANGFGFASEIPIDLSQAPLELGAAMTTVQIVVLAFESDPGPVPERVDTLADTGANLAYVVPPVAVVVN